jgi:hypothetical protein
MPMACAGSAGSCLRRRLLCPLLVPAPLLAALHLDAAKFLALPLNLLKQPLFLGLAARRRLGLVGRGAAEWSARV